MSVNTLSIASDGYLSITVAGGGAVCSQPGIELIGGQEEIAQVATQEFINIDDKKSIIELTGNKSVINISAESGVIQV